VKLTYPALKRKRVNTDTAYDYLSKQLATIVGNNRLKYL